MVRCGLCGFLIIKPQTTLHHAVWCGTMHYYLRCGYTILQVVWCSLCGLCSLVNTPTCRTKTRYNPYKS